jgi:ribosome biogenesis GTPase
MSNREEGLVLKSTGSSYLVRTKDNQVVVCKLRGNFRIKGIKSTNPIAVGDNVFFVKEGKSEQGFIIDIQERKNYIYRKSVNLSKITHIIAANIDTAFLVVSMAEPHTPLGFIDRFLVAAESFRIPTKIIFNKSDLYNAKCREMHAKLVKLYEEIGYECMETSVVSKTGMDRVKDAMQGKISLFCGQSGVGKSSIINVLEEGLNLKMNDLSRYNNKGKHTTTFAEMFPLSFGGFIIDTPGIKEFGLIQYEKEEVSHYFPEMLQLLHQCKFSNCTHTHEPECAVKQALEEGNIAQSRYFNYLSVIHNEDIQLKDWMLE